ncbi:MAG TPA: ComF family protein [Thermoleophilia bacterium]|nr:ComF family protein [Thermoleophilia bacterium]
MTAGPRVQARGALDGLLDLVFPRRCVVCRAAGTWLCATCAQDLSPLPDDRCGRCGAPLGRAGRPARPARPGAAARRMPACRECAGRELAFATASAAFCYDGPARALVTACKFRALRSLVDDLSSRAAPAFDHAVLAAEAGGAELLVTSVPAHRDHRLDRGFDLAESLARRLAVGAGLTYAPLLRRVRHGARQSGLSRAARAANVHRAFALREPGFGVGTQSKRVIIVDDVYTTGETLNQCAQALAHATLRPHAFTFARTVRASACPSIARPRQ